MEPTIRNSDLDLLRDERLFTQNELLLDKKKQILDSSLDLQNNLSSVTTLKSARSK